MNYGRTLCLLALIASNSTYNCVLLAADTVHGTLRVSLSLCSLILSFSSSMLVFSRLLPRGGASHVANSFNDITLEGVILPSGLAIGGDSRISKTVIRAFRMRAPYLGWLEKALLVDEDMIVVALKCGSK